jgi:hypothetical protein
MKQLSFRDALANGAAGSPEHRAIMHHHRGALIPRRYSGCVFS